MKRYNLGPARWKRCTGQGMWKGVRSFHALWACHSHISTCSQPGAPAPLFCIRCPLPCTATWSPGISNHSFVQVDVPHQFHPHQEPSELLVTKYSGLHVWKSLQKGCQVNSATQVTYLHTHRFLRKHKCKAEGNRCFFTEPQTQDLLLEKIFRTNVMNDVSQAINTRNSLLGDRDL